MIRLKEKYQKEIIPAMKEKFGYKNNMMVPKIKKIIINSCFGKEISGKTSPEREKFLQHIIEDLSLISGQKPKIITAKKSISGFKLRKNTPIAALVTLRKDRMYDFLEKLIYLVFPKSRDFKGIKPESIDKKGNLTIGFREHIVFPEISAEKEKAIFGLEVTIVTDAKNKKEGLELFQLLGLPIKIDTNV